MEYYQRFTELMCAEEEEEIETSPTYLARAGVEILVKRLGLYEDLGFSPSELARILLKSESLEPDEKDLIRVALKRIEEFDKAGYYLHEGVAL